MALISLRDVRVSFGGPAVLEHVTLQIEPGERICLLGRNGEGKSTLMHLLSGALSPDSGDIIRPQTLRVGHLPQAIPADLHGSVWDIVTQGGAAVQGAEARDGSGRQQTERVISQLSLEASAQFEHLSGGLKRRTLLGRALASQPDILLLDEPTNHLDIDAITWLETFLLRRVPTLLFVTHDRMLLRKLATRIIELDRGRLANWACDYDTFVQRKQAMLDVETEQWVQFDKKLAEEEAWLRQGIRARRTRNEGRVRDLMAMREARRARREQAGPARLQAQEAERSGRLIIEAKDISFRYDDDTPLIAAFSTTIRRGDKIGILGANGSGKTTLLRLLLKELAPLSGSVRHGTRLEVVYFDQMREQLDDNKTVQENAGSGQDTIVFNGKPQHILSYLQDFLFTADRARSPVRILSGGERNRLLLARLFLRASNVLVLDEPTNDLDAETLDLLEELLHDYRGTVVLVSHDRAFLNNVVTSVIALEGQGRALEYVGGYDDWLRQRKPAPSTPARTTAKSIKPRPPSDRPRRMNYREKRELQALPERIEAMETEQAALYECMADADFYRQDSDEIVRVKTRLATLEEDLAAAYARWEVLENLEGA